ncbi:GNAT family N-acetyltransferase [Candidatus Woesearchaeota archaeon]|nr:GNAT family N-acetyltransferase [Candidatus Woesearchaeota archaeon]
MAQCLKEVRKQLLQLGMSSITSIDDLIDRWLEFTDQQRQEGYRLLAQLEEETQSPFLVRDYDPLHDASRVASLRRYLLAVVNDPLLFPRFSLDDGSQCLVAALDQKIVGYTLYQEDNHDLFIHEVVVSPKYRRRGIMSSLLGSLQRDVPLTLLVHPSNDVALKAFGHFGFVQEGSSETGYLYLVHS